jgi:putative NADH-flavin reductase
MPTIAVFGISGRTGQALTSAARARDWAVRSYGRISSVAPMGAVVIRGDLADTGQVTNVTRDADAVCLVFGPRASQPDAFCARATRVVVEAMRAVGCRRLLAVTGAMIGEAPNRSRPMEWAARWAQARRPALARDREEQEEVILRSGLDWTIIKPPRLTLAPGTGRIAAAADLRVGLLCHLSRADLAEFMLDEIEQPRFGCQRVFVRNT